MTYVWAVAFGTWATVAACGSPAAATSFEYKATAGWSSVGTPTVTSLTIDGRPYASGQIYTLDEKYPSYEDALASFVPRAVVITTTTGTSSFQLDIGACETIPPGSLDVPITVETDQFAVGGASQSQPDVIVFGVGCFTCAGKDMTVAACP